MKNHLLVILVLILIASLSGCASVGTLLVPDDVVEDNCSWLTSATSEITSTYIDPSSYIGVGSYSLINLLQLQADVQCFSSGIEVQDVFTQGANQIVNILVPDDNLPGSTWPVWGIASGDFGDGKYQLKLLKLINISKRGSIKVSRGDDNQLRVDLDSAVVADSQNVGDGNVTSAFLELQADDNSGEITKITLKVGDKEILMTKEQVGAQVGGGFILGAVDAFQLQESDLKLNSTRAGVSPDLSFATGIGVGIEGDTGESLMLNGDLKAAINSQGFIPVVGAGNLLNIHQEGKIGVNTTEVLADRYNPANVYNLVQNENGVWSPVHPGLAPQVNADGLVVFGDEQGNPVEWMIAAVPNMFGSQEPVTLIVKDKSLILDRLKDLGYEFVNATVFTALIDSSTGEIMSLVPSIHEGEIKMSQDGQGKLAITVQNAGETQHFELAASAEAFFSTLLKDVLTQLPEGYSVNGGQLLDQAGVSMGKIEKGQNEGSFNLTFTTTDFLTDEIQEHSIDLASVTVHPKGAVILDSGERTGFVWKGNEWANILLDIQFQTDGTRFNEFPTVLYEDVVSGALAEAERLEAEPFPEGVEPLNNYSLNSFYGSIVLDYVDKKSRIEAFSKIEKLPMSFKYFYKTVINNTPVLMSTLQILNLNNSSVFIHFVESEIFLESQLNYWNNMIQFKFVPIFSLALGGTTNYDYCQDGWSDAAKQVCALNTPNNESLIKLRGEWVRTQKIPDKFEKVLFAYENIKAY